MGKKSGEAMDLREFFGFLEDLKVQKKASREVALENARNRILAADIAAKIDIPRFDNAAMDGFALRLGFSEYVLKNSVFAGEGKKIPALKNNEAFRITTGAKIPRGAEAVVQKEMANLSGEKITLQAPAREGQSIKLRGEDFKKGEVLLEAGALLTPQNVGILAAQGFQKVPVRRRVKVAIFGSGNEVALLGSRLKNSQIYDINSHFIAANLANLNCKITYGGILSDDLEALSAALKEAAGKFDIVITSGGVSVGEKDYIHKALRRVGARILIDSLDIKPGRPVVFSKLGDSFILNLPGNPIAAFLQTMFFVPLLSQKMSAAREKYFKKFEAINECDLRLTNGTSHIILGHLENGHFRAFNGGKYQGALAAPLLKSNALAIFYHRDGVKKGEVVNVLRYEPSFLDGAFEIFN